MPLSRNLLGSVEPCFFLPYSSVSVGRKDGFKVLVTLQESAMPAFREEFGPFGNPFSKHVFCQNNVLKMKL
jgi:hypothetical protein